MTVLFVTGTGTDVGKTVVTAALAACATGSVAVVKPAQTGVADGAPGDLAEVTRLSGCTDVHEFVRYPQPLSPHHAARLSGRPDLDPGETVMRIADLANSRDLVIVEGAGGLLVPYDRDGTTLLDLYYEFDAAFVVVTSPGLGTLNHTALTMRLLDEGAADIAGIIVGRWPQHPGLAELCNVFDLARMGPRRALGGVLPDGVTASEDFPAQARAALAPTFGGSFDWPSFRAAVAESIRP